MNKGKLLINRIIKLLITGMCIILTVALLSGCTGNVDATKSAGIVPYFSPPPIPTTQIVNLLGAGSAPFDRLAYQWADDYKTISGVKISYQPVGAPTALGALANGTMNFLVLDSVITADQQKTAAGANGAILCIPAAISIMAIAYNLPDLTQGNLQITGNVLAEIYMGKIINWNDPAIVALNPGLILPDAKIITVYNDQQSGSNYIFSDFLVATSQAWETKYGSASWNPPTGSIGGVGDDGSARIISQTPDSIGYVEFGQIDRFKLTAASVQNANGSFITPTPDSAAKSAVGITIPDNAIISIADSAQPGAYPIDGFFWILVYQNQPDNETGKTLANWLWWTINDGQKECQALDYAPLPASMVTKAEALISSMQYQGKPLISSIPGN